MGLDLGGSAHNLAVQGVLHAVFHLDDDGLIHLVAGDVSTTTLAVSASLFVANIVFGGLVTLLQLGGHYALSSVASGVSAFSAFLVDFFAGFSMGAGVARIPSSRSRITV